MQHFEFMTSHIDFSGQNRVSVYGYSAVGTNVQIANIYEAEGKYIDQLQISFQNILINIQTAIRNPRNIQHSSANMKLAFDEIKNHLKNYYPNGKAIILRTGILCSSLFGKNVI